MRPRNPLVTRSSANELASQCPPTKLETKEKKVVEFVNALRDTIYELIQHTHLLQPGFALAVKLT